MALLIGIGGCADSDREERAALADSTSALASGTSVPELVRLDAAELRALGAFERDGAVRCTGALVAPRRVLTAAHCFIREDDLAPFDFVTAGGDDAPTVLPLQRVAFHPTLDLAVVTLGAELPSEVVTPLAVRTEPLEDGAATASIEAAGAGLGSSAGVTFGVFSVDAIDATRVEITTDSARGLCAGDSGGPFLRPPVPAGRAGPTGSSARPEVIAVTSTSAPNCASPAFGTRTDIAAGWIGAVIAEPLPAPSAACDDTRDQRACDGDRARRCRAGYWRERACDESQLACGALAGGGEGCLPAACGAIDRYGTCSDGVARWCGRAGAESLDCAARDLGCDYSAAEDGYRCVDCGAAGFERAGAACGHPAVAATVPRDRSGCASDPRAGSGLGLSSAIACVAWLHRRRFSV